MEPNKDTLVWNPALLRARVAELEREVERLKGPAFITIQANASVPVNLAPGSVWSVDESPLRERVKELEAEVERLRSELQQVRESACFAESVVRQTRITIRQGKPTTEAGNG